MSNVASLADSIILVTQAGMGSAPPDLQQKLLGTYLGLLAEAGSLPAAICFYTEGVKLVVEGSPEVNWMEAGLRASMQRAFSLGLPTEMRVN